MSAVFDTIDRATLLNILETIIEEDELRLVRFLLSNTCLNIRIGGTKEEKKFTSNIGTPQGDSLSPILFVVYLENALKEVRPLLPQPVIESEKTLPNGLAYLCRLRELHSTRENRRNTDTEGSKKIQP